MECTFKSEIEDLTEKYDKLQKDYTVASNKLKETIQVIKKASDTIDQRDSIID